MPPLDPVEITITPLTAVHDTQPLPHQSDTKVEHQMINTATGWRNVADPLPRDSSEHVVTSNDAPQRGCTDVQGRQPRPPMPGSSTPPAPTRTTSDALPGAPSRGALVPRAPVPAREQHCSPGALSILDRASGAGDSATGHRHGRYGSRLPEHVQLDHPPRPPVRTKNQLPCPNRILEPYTSGRRRMRGFSCREWSSRRCTRGAGTRPWSAAGPPGPGR
jgi:hypothetical protein